MNGKMKISRMIEVMQEMLEENGDHHVDMCIYPNDDAVEFLDAPPKRIVFYPAAHGQEPSYTIYGEEPNE